VACGGLEYYGNAALLRSVAVESGHRGRGLGQSLVTGLLAAAANRCIGSVVLLTTTAEDFFPRMGFRAVPRSSLPAAVMASAEFKGACPDSATAMMLRLPRLQEVQVGLPP
jgi:amino-acid N-acetyltransferase